MKRLRKLFRNKAKVEALLVRVAGDTAEALCERFGIAVFAARAYLCASPERVPRGICPFDFGMFTHGWSPFILPMLGVK